MKNMYIYIVLALALVIILSGVVAVVNRLWFNKACALGPVVSVKKTNNSIRESMLKDMKILTERLDALELKFEKLNKKILCSLTFLENLKNDKLDNMPEQCAMYKELDFKLLNALWEISKLFNLSNNEYYDKLHNSSSPILIHAKNKQFLQNLEKIAPNLEIKRKNLNMCQDAMHAYCVRLLKQVNEVLNGAPIEPELWSMLNSAVQCALLGNIGKELNFFNHIDLYIILLTGTFSVVIDKNCVLKITLLKSDNHLLQNNLCIEEPGLLNTKQLALNESEVMLSIKRNAKNDEMYAVINKIVRWFGAAGISAYFGDCNIKSLNNIIYKEAINVENASINISDVIELMNECNNGTGSKDLRNARTLSASENGNGIKCLFLNANPSTDGAESLIKNVDKPVGYVIESAGVNNVNDAISVNPSDGDIVSFIKDVDKPVGDVIEDAGIVLNVDGAASPIKNIEKFVSNNDEVEGVDSVKKPTGNAVEGTGINGVNNANSTFVNTNRNASKGANFVKDVNKPAGNAVVKGAGKSAAKGVNGVKTVGVNFNNVSKRANKSVNNTPNAGIKINKHNCASIGANASKRVNGTKNVSKSAGKRKNSKTVN